VKDTGIDVHVYPRDVRIHVHRFRNQIPPIGKRRKITEFSDKSRNRLLFAAFNASVDWFAFLALTYPAEFPTNGLVVRRHRNQFLIYLRRQHPGIHYLWALEFQERGAPHLHLLVDQYVAKEWLSDIWFAIVDSGDEKHLRSGTRIESVRGREHGASYLAKKYTGKKAQKEVPVEYQNVGRFWGMSRSLVAPQQSATFEINPESVQVVRTLRRFVEKERVKVKRLRPVSEHHSRKRYVRRKQTLHHLHTGLNGFTVYGGATVGAQLLDSIESEKQRNDSTAPDAEKDKGE
jgi:hypothetical protein